DGHAKCVRGAAEAFELRHPYEDADVVEIDHVQTFAWAQKTFQISPPNREIAPVPNDRRKGNQAHGEIKWRTRPSSSRALLRASAPASLTAFSKGVITLSRPRAASASRRRSAHPIAWPASMATSPSRRRPRPPSKPRLRGSARSTL